VIIVYKPPKRQKKYTNIKKNLIKKTLDILVFVNACIEDNKLNLTIIIEAKKITINLIKVSFLKNLT
jgi:hypothetical protein